MSGINPMTSVGGVNLLGGGMLQDPRMAIVNSLMQSGQDASPVRSGWQEAARAAQGIIGALMYNKVQGENSDAMGGLDAYMKADPQTQADMAAKNPRLQQIAGVLGMQRNLMGQEAKIKAEAKSYEPYTLGAGEQRMGPNGPIASGPSLWSGAPDASGAAPAIAPAVAPAAAPLPVAPNAAMPPAPVTTSPLNDAGVQKIASAENGTGNPAAANPNSSAVGDGQFLKGTWLEQFKKSYPDQAKGMSDDQILALRSNPTLSRNLIGAYARDNYGFLTGKGVPNVGVPELSLAHAVGPQGAFNVLSANPAAPAEKVLSPEAIAANPQFKGQTAGQIRQWAADRVGAPVAPAGANAAPGGSQPDQSNVRWIQMMNQKDGKIIEYAVDPNGKPLLDQRGQPYYRPFQTATPGQRRTLSGNMEVDPVANDAAAAKITAETPPTIDRATQMIPVTAGQAGATKTAESEAALAPAPAGTPLPPGAPNTMASAQAASTAAGTRAAENAAIPNQPMTHEQTIAAQSKMNDAFMNNPQVKEHYEVSKNFQSVIDAAKGNDKASDINLIDGLVKMFNPGATVRQSTFETFMEHSQGLPSNVVGLVHSWFTNDQHLQPDTRQQLLDQAAIRMQSSRSNYNQFADFAGQSAQASGLNPDAVVPKFVDPLTRLEQAHQPLPGAPKDTRLPGQNAQQPPVAGAKMANDGHWYVSNPAGGFYRVDK